MILFSRYVRMSLPRRWASDLVYFGSRGMVVGVHTALRTSVVAAARRNRQPLISWNAIFTKAIALTSRKWPELKRCYVPFPLPHFYEHPHSVVSVVLERKWRGENAVFIDQIHAPESKSLREIDHVLTGLKRREVEAVGGFRRMIRISRFPRPLRRLIWRIVLYGSGRLKSRYFGTFSINSLSSRRTRATQIASPITFGFYYGALLPNGDLPCQIFFDHRVLDGVTVDRILAHLQVTLNRDIVDELNNGSE